MCDTGIYAIIANQNLKYENLTFKYAKIKATSQLISAFVFASYIVQLLLLPKSEISSAEPASEVVQPGLCLT